jgi:hypothetical protein
MIIFDNPATVPAPAGQYSHLARLDLGYKTMLQLSGQVAIDADGKIVGPDDMFAQGCGRRASPGPRQPSRPWKYHGCGFRARSLKSRCSRSSDSPIALSRRYLRNQPGARS